MRHSPNSPNTAPATKNDTHHWSKLTKSCACHEKWHFNFTKYCACHEKWISWLILVTDETLFTMRGATSVIVQTHQILRLPRKMNLMIDPWHKWNVIYNARSNMRHSPNSPNTAPATKNDRPESQRNWLKTNETSFPMRGRSDHDPRMIREWNRQSATRLATEVTFHAHHEHFVLKITTFRAPAIIPNFTEYCACHEKWHLNFTKYCACHEKWHLHFTKYCACHEKWISWLILDTNETLFTMRGATCVIVQTHQILRLPRKMTVPNLKEIYWKRMKRHFQCAADPTMIRAWSDHETVSPQPASQPRLLFTPTTSILYWKIQHFALRLSFQISPNTAPATKSDTRTSPNTAPATKSDTCTSPNTAPATKSDTSTSPNTAPATKIELLLNLTTLLDDITWRHLLLDDITWRHLLLDDT